jgi:hypothetical protein
MKHPLAILLFLIFTALTPSTFAHDEVHPALWLGYQDIDSWKGITSECKEKLVEHGGFAVKDVDMEKMGIYVSHATPAYIAMDVRVYHLGKRVILLHDRTLAESSHRVPNVAKSLCDSEDMSHLTVIPTQDYTLHRALPHYSSFLPSMYQKIKKIPFSRNAFDGLHAKTFDRLVRRYELTPRSSDGKYELALLFSEQQPGLVLLHLTYRCLRHSAITTDCENLIAIVPSHQPAEYLWIQNEEDVFNVVYHERAFPFHIVDPDYGIREHEVDGYWRVYK